MSWLPRASAHASRVDVLFIGLMVMSALVLLLLFWLLLRFAIHYRAGNLAADRDHRIKKSWHWEVAWTTATLVGFLGLFVWGAYLFVDLYAGQRDALPVYVVAKQWMWKAQHLGGQREINELHVPLGHTIRLIMSSQDVIHSFFLPAFRIKHDLVPGTTSCLMRNAGMKNEWITSCDDMTRRMVWPSGTCSSLISRCPVRCCAFHIHCFATT